jgi:HD superfamily phosphohydrolase YqeK
MSGGNALFITLHYTGKAEYTCQDVILYLSPYTQLTRLYIHVSRQYSIITLQYNDKAVYTCQEVILYLSHYITQTWLYVHVRR